VGEGGGPKKIFPGQRIPATFGLGSVIFLKNFIFPGAKKKYFLGISGESLLLRNGKYPHGSTIFRKSRPCLFAIIPANMPFSQESLLFWCWISVENRTISQFSAGNRGIPAGFRTVSHFSDNNYQ